MDANLIDNELLDSETQRWIDKIAEVATIDQIKEKLAALEATIDRLTLAFDGKLHVKDEPEQNLNLVYPIAKEVSTKLDLHRGYPSQEQLRKICDWTDEEWSTEDWYVVPFEASNNLVSRSARKWHLNVLRQMESGMPGRNLLLDHEWEEVEETVGFIYDAKLIISPSCSDEVMAKGGWLEENRSIVASEGYAQLYLFAAIGSDMESVVEGCKRRRLNDSSTGGLLNNIQIYCPICSAEYGEDVSFLATDEDGDYICPHAAPGMSAYMEEMPQEAPYIVYDGYFDSVELSLCVAGNLPNASIVRGMK